MLRSLEERGSILRRGVVLERCGVVHWKSSVIGQNHRISTYNKNVLNNYNTGAFGGCGESFFFLGVGVWSTPGEAKGLILA